MDGQQNNNRYNSSVDSLNSSLEGESYDSQALDNAASVSDQQMMAGVSVGELETNGHPTGVRPPKPNLFQRAPKLMIALGLALLTLIVAGLLYAVWTHVHPHSSSQSKTALPVSVPSTDLSKIQANGINNAQQLSINGNLQINRGLVLTPSAAPEKPTEGQIYLSATDHLLYYYDGTAFVSLVSATSKTPLPAGVTSLGGSTGALKLGSGLSTDGLSITNSGVLGINGLTGGLKFANVSSSDGVTLTIDNASTTGKGLASFNPTNFLASGGVVTTVQNIDPGATPTFAGVNTNSINPSGSLTVGSTSQTLTLQGNGLSTLTATSGGSTTVLAFQSPTANVTYTLPTAPAGSYDICTTFGNCGGGGSGNVSTAGGTTNQIVKFSAGQTIADSIISDNGALVTVGGGLTVSGSATFSSLGAGLLQSSAGGAISSGAVDRNSAVFFNTALTVANGGTGATTVGGARTNLGAAASGANSDITSLSGLTTALSVIQGGTGASSLALNGILIGNGAGAVTSLVAGASNLCLVSSAGAPVWQACPGSGGVTSIDGQNGILTLANSSGVAGTITINDATNTGSKGIASFNSTNFNVVAGAVNTVQNISTTATPTFGSLTLTTALSVANGGTGAITAANARTNLGAAASGANSDITSLSGLTTALSVLQGGTGASSLTANGLLVGNGTSGVTTISAASAGLCLVSNAGAPSFQSCPGGGSVGTSGSATQNKVAKFGASGTSITDSSIYDNGSGVSVGNTSVTGLFNVGASNQFQVSSTGAVTAVGLNAGAGLIQGSSGLSVGGSIAFTSLTSAGGQCLTTDGSGNLSLVNCLSGGSGGSGGVSSLNGLSGSLSINNATGSGAAITINNAAADGSTKGIATFNSTNFSAASGVVNTIQGIATTSTPTFAGLTLNASGLSAGGTITFSGAGFASDGIVTSVSGVLASGSVNLGTSGYLTGTLGVGKGGTGLNTLTANQLLYASTSSTINQLANGSANQCLISNGAGAAPSFQTCTGAGGVSSITATTAQSGALTFNGTANQVSVSNTGATFTFATPQNIGTASDVTFNSLNAASILKTNATTRIDASGNLTNIGTINTSGLITGGAGLTISTGTITLNNLTGGASKCLTLNGSNQVGVSTCATGSGSSPTLQDVYDNSTTTPLINLASVGKGITIQDAATPVGGNLLAVKNSAGTTTYFDVTTSGADITGTLTATNLSGNGSAVTNVNAAQLNGQAASYYLNANNINAGTLGDAFLSSNVALYNRATSNFTGALQHNGNAVCDTSGNCVGTGGGGAVGGGGTLNKIALFTGSGFTIGDSILSQNVGATTVSITGALSVTGSVTAASFAGDGTSVTNVDAAKLNGQAGSYYTNATNLSSGTVANGRLSGSYTGVTGVGALAAGSIAAGFGTIATANTITGTTLNGTTSINTGAGAGTQRIDASGNLTNIGTINTSGLITGGSGLTITSGTVTLNNLTGGTSKCLTLNASNQVGVATCATGSGSSPTLQDVYDNSASGSKIITLLTGATNGVAIQDASTPVGANLLSVKNNAGSTTYFGVTATGTSITGTLAATGSIQFSSLTSAGGQCLTTDGSGNLSLIACLSGAGGGSGGVVSLNGDSGTILLNNASASDATHITINNAAADGTTKGIATFTSSNFSAAAGVVSIKTGGVTTTEILDGTIANADLAGGTYAAITGTGALTAGSIASGFGVISTGNNITTSAAVQGGTGAFTGASSLALGTASTNTGSIKLYSSLASGSVTLSLANPGTNNFTLSIPTLTGNDTICVVSVGCGSGSGATTVGALDGGVANANGATISSNTLYLQSASASFAGVVNTGSQVFAGSKTFNGNVTIGASAGSGTTLTNNGSIVNSVLAKTDFATGGSIGTAATTVDVYSAISVAQTTPGQALTIPSPTANTAYGRIIYFSNVGTTSFTFTNTNLAASLNPGVTAVLVWSNTNGGASWTYAGDGSSILNQNSVTQTANFKINGTGIANVLQAANASFTGTNSLTLGAASTNTGSIKLYNSGSANSVTLQSAAQTGSGVVITIPDTGGVSANVCLSTGNCTSGAGAATLQTAYVASIGSTTPEIKLNAAQGALDIQDADTTLGGNLINVRGSNSGGLGSVLFSVNSSGNSTLSGNITVGGSVIISGSSSFPGSPIAGQIYYRSDTNQLYVYNGTKWTAYGGSTATVVVSANNSQNKEKADFVGNGTNDDVAINAAIAALPASGGSVVLLDGTYNITADITLNKAGMLLVGQGDSTILKRMYDNASSGFGVINAASANVSVQQLSVNGNKASFSNANDNGIAINASNVTVLKTTVNAVANIGVGILTNALGDLRILNNVITSSTSHGIFVGNNTSAEITDNNICSNGGAGISLSNSNHISLTNNVICSNTTWGITGGGGGETYTGNSIKSNGAGGIQMASDSTASGNVIDSNSGPGISTGTHETITGNTISSNTIGISETSGSAVDSNTISGNVIETNLSYGIYLHHSQNNTIITGNRLINNTGSSSDSSIVIDDFSSFNQVTNNLITDTAGTGFAIQIGNNSVNTYISNNTYSGTGASSISDAGIGTIYANQQDSSGNLLNVSQGGGLTVGRSSANATLSLQGGLVSNQLPAPTIGTAVLTGTGNGVTYRYQVTALDGTGESTGSAIASNANGPTTLSGGNFLTLTWTAVPGAYQYNIYRCTVAACSPLKLATVAGNTTSYNDQAAGSPSGAVPSSNTTGGGTFAGTLQGSSGIFTGTNALTLGTASSTTGAIVFKGSGGAGTLTLAGPTTPNAGNFTLSIPAISGNATICTTDSVCGIGAGGTNNYLSQVPSSNTANAAGANIISPTAASIIGLTVNATTGTAATAAVINQTQNAVGLQINNSGTSSALSITTTGNPAANNALIFANNNSTTPSGNLLELQNKNVDKFTVDAAGAVSAVSNINTSAYFKQAGSIVINTTTGTDSTFLGVGAGNTTATATNASATGKFALNSITSGNNNTATGYAAAFTTTSGTDNTAIGAGALFANKTGNFNTAIGSGAGYAFTCGGSCAVNGNTTIGYNAGANIIGGADNNTLLGNQAGVSLTSGANNIIIGYNVQAPSASGSNQINIGNTFYGNSSTGRVSLGAALGAGSAILNVGTTAQFTVDASGNVVTSGTYNTNTLSSSSLQFGANSAASISSNSANTLTVDTGGAAQLSLGTANANAISISKAGFNTLVNGSFTSTQLLTANGGATIATGKNFVNGGSTLNSSIALPLGSSGTIGSNTTTVDAATTLDITATAGSLAFTIPSPSVTTSGRIIYVNNVGSNAFSISSQFGGGGSVTVPVGSSANLIWNGTTWTSTAVSTGVSIIGTFSLSPQANGASISGNTITFAAADRTNPGMVSAAAQTFGGSKNFAGNIFTVSNAADSAISFKVDTTTGTITLGTGTNSVQFDTTNGFTANTGARHTKNITLPAEYAGAVLDAGTGTGCTTGNSGIMTSGYDSSAARHNFYQWTPSSSGTHCYDVIVQIPLPSDWAGWTGTPTLYTYNNVGTNSTSVYVQAIGTNGTTDTSYGSFVGISSGTTLQSTNLTAFDGTNYSAGGYMTLKIRMSGAATTTNVRIGNINIPYKSLY